MPSPWKTGSAKYSGSPPAYEAAPAQPPQPQFFGPGTQPQYPPSQQAQSGERYRTELYVRCAQGYHVPTTRFGLCGILCAIFCFPFGLICCFLDTNTVCARCGLQM